MQKQECFENKPFDCYFCESAEDLITAFKSIGAENVIVEKYGMQFNWRSNMSFLIGMSFPHEGDILNTCPLPYYLVNGNNYRRILTVSEFNEIYKIV